MLAGLIMFLVSILSGCEMYKYREYAWDSVRNKSYLKYDISIDKAMVNTNKTSINHRLLSFTHFTNCKHSYSLILIDSQTFTIFSPRSLTSNYPMIIL